MKICVVDLETIPSQIISAELKAAFTETIKTGNIKDPLKIAEKVNKKMGTDRDLCQVTTFVGYVYSTAESKILDKRVAQWPPLDEEYEVVSDAWDFIKQAFNARIPIVTFGGVNFDLPVLFTAAMRLDIPVSRIMYDKLVYRYENLYHYDLMRSLTGEIHPVAGKSLEFYLHFYQLGHKTEGMDGSKVYPAWLNKEYKKISDYCEQDVLQTAKLFERVEPWLPKDPDAKEDIPEEVDEGQELSDDKLWVDDQTDNPNT